METGIETREEREYRGRMIERDGSRAAGETSLLSSVCEANSPRFIATATKPPFAPLISHILGIFAIRATYTYRMTVWEKLLFFLADISLQTLKCFNLCHLNPRARGNR